MLVKMGIADSLLGGATYSTADTVRPALQLIKTRPGNTLVSSCFILVRPFATGGNEVFAMGDCGTTLSQMKMSWLRSQRRLFVVQESSV